MAEYLRALESLLQAWKSLEQAADWLRAAAPLCPICQVRQREWLTGPRGDGAWGDCCTHQVCNDQLQEFEDDMREWDLELMAEAA